MLTCTWPSGDSCLTRYSAEHKVCSVYTVFKRL